MALDAHAPAHGHHSVPPTLEEEDDFYTKVLDLRDAVVEGRHPTLKLPAAAIEALKASLHVPQSPENGSQHAEPPRETSNALTNGLPSSANAAAPPTMMYPGLPGLGSSIPPTQQYHAKPASAGLDPIFLEKSDSLVRAEGQLKRQRIERDLFDNWEKRKQLSGRDKEGAPEGPSNISIDAALADAQRRVKPISGLRAAYRAGSAATSFDENDYYSSQVQSEWSSDVASGNGSDQAVGAFTADVETLDHRNGVAAASSKARGKQPVQANGTLHRADVSSASKNRPNIFTHETDGVNEADDEDEEYSPPDPAAFDSFYDADTTMDVHDVGADEDDDSEYEPGEVTQDSVVVTPYANNQPSAQPSPQVPIYRNHLSTIAAPQPNRVSPLAVQKGPSIELELVNGCPEVVHKPQKRYAQVQSRPSSASPPGPGTGPGSRKKKNKKRKRELEASNRSKKRQERQNAQSPVSPIYKEPYIKPEPLSPPPFTNVPEVQPYPYRYTNPAAPIQLDPEPPRNIPQPQYVYASSPRYEYAPSMPPPTAVRVSSASGYRPAQRDTQDLRRVASLHYAQRPVSPAQRVYSPAAAYSSNGRAYTERQASVVPYAPDTGYDQEGSAVRYLPTEPHHEPVRLQEYRESSPAMMPPPPAPRRVVVDQYGNKYYAAEPSMHTRASVAPVGRHGEPELGYERASSRMPGSYTLPPQAAPYEPVESAMGPPPVRRHAPPEQAVEHLDSNGYRVREYSTRPAEPIRYSHAPTSPVYQQPPQYDHMPPPSARPAPRESHYEPVPPPSVPHETTSPVYAAPSRAYSVRPDAQDPPQFTYAPRQASVAPVQYVRHEAPPPPRAMSVMPAPEYGAPAYQQRAPSYAPVPQQPAVRYLDEYGREVVPREVRQGSQFRY